jgi:hypothetical protein
LDKEYQPDYAAHQLGLFVADFIFHHSLAKQQPKDQPGGEDAGVSWKYQASRLIEALEFMKAQTKNAHVARVVDESLKPLKTIEKALPPPNAFDLEQILQAEASPSQQLYKGDPNTVVKPANRKDKDAAAPPPPPPVKPEEKKDK